MASREQLRIIRAARMGEASAQLILGKHYLFGSAGLPKNMATALHWLDRAAQQHVPEAWLLIGARIPFDVAHHHAADMTRVLIWYERAFDARVIEAGLTFARLVWAQGRCQKNESLRRKAMLALQKAAQAGIAEAQWLLAQQDSSVVSNSSARTEFDAPLKWAACAANNGVLAARYALADHAWASADYDAFLHWSLPVARELVERLHAVPAT